MSTRALRFAVAASFLAMLGRSFADDPPAPAPAVVHPATIEELGRMFQDVQKAKDAKRAGELGASVVPTSVELRGLLRPGEPTDAFLKDYAAKGPVDWKADSDPAKSLGAGLFAPGDPKRTEIKTYSATTEEIAAYEKGGTAFLEFPGGMKRFAEMVAAPGRTWWLAECVEPGSSTGVKFTCFTRLGDRWIFVAKPWRSVLRDPDDKKVPDPPDPK